MPWIRFWVGSNCPSGHNSEDSRYEWFDVAPSEDSLEDSAQDYASESYLWHSERGCRYGFEVLEALPEEVRKKLIREYEGRKRYAEVMLDRLHGRTPKPEPKKPKRKTSWERLGEDD